VGRDDSSEQKVSELNVSGLLGWKTHVELQKLDRCS